MRMRWTGLICGFLGMGVCALAAGEGPEQSFGERIDVRVVNVEAVVTGRGGERVQGLTAADFRLLVDGREVPVEFFSEIEEAGGTGVRPQPDAGGAPAPPASRQGRSVLVFVDDSFAVGAHRDLVIQALVEDLPLLGPEDRMAVVAFDGARLAVLSGWTGDTAALAGVLRGAARRPARGIEVVAARRSEEGDRELISEALADFEDLAETDPFWSMAWDGFEVPAPLVPMDVMIYSRLLQTTEAAAAALRGFPLPPGRRTMLLLSGGWPLPQLLLPLVRDANRLGYTLYPVDVAGLSSAPSNDVTQSAPSLGGFITDEWERSVHDSLEFIAAATGGKATLNTNRTAALERMVEDTRAYYWLGFTPSWKGDDRHHSIRLEARRPGLSVRARRSFSDLSQRSEQDFTTEGLLLFGDGPERPEAWGEPRLVVQIGTPQRTGRRTIEVPLTLQVPVESLTALPAKEGYVAEAALALGTVDQAGRVADLPTRVVQLLLPEAPRPGSMALLTTSVKLSREEQKLVVTLRDALAGSLVWGKAEVSP